jgi:MATE family multidrug resistance protein
MLLVAAVNGFFAGRQQSWTVFLINTVGAIVNALCAIPLILWNADDPMAAMRGAGYAPAIGSTVSAIFGLALMLRPRFQEEYHILSGWRFDRALFLRLMRFGIPNGLQYCIEGLAFTIFILLIGNIGRAELAASTLAFSLNLLTFLPIMGLGQGVEVLVGQRQGESRPELAARTTHAGAVLATMYMTILAVCYLTIPETIVWPFGAEMKPEEWAIVGPLIPILLRFIAGYSLADGANIIYAYALRGAGDTRFVTLVTIITSWPILVIPTYLCWKLNWGLLAAWGFATVYVVVLAGIFWLRFLGGRWKSMRVIETTVVDVEPAAAVTVQPVAEGQPESKA